jgi:cellulose synthase operon protein C
MPYYSLGYAFKDRGNRTEAISAFKSYLARKPDAVDKAVIDDEIYDLSHR